MHLIHEYLNRRTRNVWARNCTISVERSFYHKRRRALTHNECDSRVDCIEEQFHRILFVKLVLFVKLYNCIEINNCIENVLKIKIVLNCIENKNTLLQCIFFPYYFSISMYLSVTFLKNLYFVTSDYQK